MKILVISQVYPYPLHDGGRVDIYYRLKALKSLGHEVYLVPFYNPAFGLPDVKVLEPLCQKIFPIAYLRRKLSKIFSHRPYFIGSKENEGALKQCLQMLEGEKFDGVIAESHHVVEVADRFRKALSIPRLVLRSHNNEPKFIFSLAKSSPLFSIEQAFFFLEGIKYRFYEKKLLKSLQAQDAVWHISHDEKKRYSAKYPEMNQFFLPAGIDIHEKLECPLSKSANVLFVGALFSPNNLQGLKWYLKHVHPLLVRTVKNYKLIVAGNTKGASQKRLDALFNGITHFQLHDTPAKLDPLYEDAAVFINPMLCGAGVKLKTVQAALKGVAIVTTSCGNEGTGLKNGEHLFVSDTPDGFFEKIMMLLNDTSLRESTRQKAQLFIEDLYDHPKQLQHLIVT